MSIRAYLLYIALTLFLLILIGTLIWPFLHVDRYLTNLIVDQFGRSFSGVVSLKRATPGFLALNLYDLEIRDKRDVIRLKVRHARVKFNVVMLVKRRFKVLHSIESIVLLGPDISYRLLPTESSDGRSANEQYLNWEILGSIPDYLWIPQVDLSLGSIRVLPVKGDPLFSIQDLSGSLISPAPGIIKSRIQDEPPNGISTEAVISILLDRDRRIFESYLTTSYRNIQLNEKQGLPDSLVLSLDSLNLGVRFWVDGDRSDLVGEARMRSFTLRYRTRPVIRFDSVKVAIGNWGFKILEAKATGMMEEWLLQGGIDDIRKPDLNLTLEGRSTDSRRLQSWLPSTLGIESSGESQVRIRIGGEPFAPSVRFQGSLQRLRTNIDIFENVDIFFEYNRKILKINSLTASLPSGAVNCVGNLDFGLEGRDYFGTFIWRGGLPGLKESRSGLLEFGISGLKGLFQLDGNWIADTGPGDSINVHTSFSSSTNQIKCRIHIPESRSTLDLIVNSISTENNFILRFDQPLSILKNLIEWDEWDRYKRISLSGSLTGSPDQMATEFEIFYGGGPSRFHFDGSVVAGDDKGYFYTGDLEFQQGRGPILQGNLDLAWEHGLLTLETLSLDNAIFGHGSVNFHSGEFGFSELRISNWDVSRGIQLILPQWAVRVGGVLDGRLEIFGSFDDPFATINLYASRGYYQEQSGLWAVFSAELQDGVISVSECNIGRSVQSLVKLTGSVNLSNHELNLTLSSQGADISDFLDFAGANPLLVSGPLTLYASIKGSFNCPEILINIYVSAGRMYKLPFEQITVTAELDSSTNYNLTVDQFRLVQAPDLLVTGSGTLPIGQSSLALNMLIEGNVLKMPHLIERAITVSQGQGRIQLEFGEREGQVILKSARMEIRDGVMQFVDVVDEIRGLHANMRLQEGRLFIDNLSGEVNRQPFRFSNFFVDKTNRSELQHLYFPAIDLDLGIITFETHGRGLYARIPSLMPHGVKGYVNFEGKGDNYYFLFGGPVHKPLFRGTLRVASTILTYPFPPAKKEPSLFIRRVLEVLSSVRWDVDIIPERDNRYVKELRTAADTFFLDGVSDLFTTVDIRLNINPGRSNLHMKGSFADGNFRFLGSLISTRGTIDYLDLKFNVDRFIVEFDLHDPLPWVEGRGQTVYIDSLGRTRNILLTLYVVDPVTGERVRRGRWGEFVFIIEDEAGSSQEQILASMGYSPEQIQDKMTSISGQIISDAVLRRFIRPIERELESVLNVDLIQLQPTFAQHFFESRFFGLDPGPEGQEDWGAYLLRRSQVSVGKYIGNDIFVSYTGRWDTGINAREERRYGFLHKWNIEYRIRPISDNLVLNLGYEYDTLEDLKDQEAALRYSFIF